MNKPACSGSTLTELGEGAVHTPADGFFVDAAYLGAVRDAADTWATAAWTRWD